MTKEGRLNLIFFAVLLLLMLPGFLILMSRKLNGPADPNYMPNPLQHVAAYMQPPPIPPTVPRTEPQEVRDWVTQLLHDRIDPKATMARSAEDGPAIGDQFRSQVVYAHRESRTSYRVAVLIWSRDVLLDGPNAPRLKLDVLDMQNQTTSSAEAIDVPKAIRRALQKIGYIDPPLRVVWVDATFSLSNSDPTPHAVIVDATIDGKRMSERCAY